MKATVVLVLFGLGLVSPACQPGWTQFKEDCLLISNHQRIWLDAESDCRHHGGWLMSDDNEPKHDFLATLLYPFKNFHMTHYFIGGSDTAFENQWRWLETGVNAGPFTKWGTGEPDGNNSKNCLGLKWEDDRSLVWSDESCGHAASHHHHAHGQMYYICEKPVNNSGSMAIGRR
ncbi:lactose-binding lectin l-2-like [Mizuhopecten yessoensis]|uniref:Lactose-binding lectin l-2 n=1 Tax=Mizuhopecten yessoensis TaxID=6573 RepID=A0A210PXC0_MIZYE|nr:lactose-binding lectin l-2-like [Mizuhopecten yessoensis]OWF41112.1 Lactose-binding lectin l-2 [Mizuhopecten yessoensis]